MAEVDRKQPALIGGVIFGVLSAIPFLSTGNCLCCLWALVGGVIASKLLISASPRPVTPGEGAITGLYAGLIGSVIFLIVGLPLSAALSPYTLGFLENLSAGLDNPQIQDAIRRSVEVARSKSFLQLLFDPMTILFALAQAVVFCGFTALGGLLGVALFEKRKGEPPLPPPPSYPPPATPDSAASQGPDGPPLFSAERGNH